MPLPDSFWQPDPKQVRFTIAEEFIRRHPEVAVNAAKNPRPVPEAGPERERFIDALVDAYREAGVLADAE